MDTMRDDDTGEGAEADTRRIAPPITLTEWLERPPSACEIELARVLDLLRGGYGTRLRRHGHRRAPGARRFISSLGILHRMCAGRRSGSERTDDGRALGHRSLAFMLER